MDTVSLIYFSEAAKDLNFTKTAQRLFISQQTLSNHIARLEEAYQVKLFERKPRLMLTSAGETLLSFARDYKTSEENLKAQLTDISQRESAQLRIGCTPHRTSIVMPFWPRSSLSATPMWSWISMCTTPRTWWRCWSTESWTLPWPSRR